MKVRAYVVTIQQENGTSDLAMAQTIADSLDDAGIPVQKVNPFGGEEQGVVQLSKPTADPYQMGAINPLS